MKSHIQLSRGHCPKFSDWRAYIYNILVYSFFINKAYLWTIVIIICIIWDIFLAVLTHVNHLQAVPQSTFEEFSSAGDLLEFLCSRGCTARDKAGDSEVGSTRGKRSGSPPVLAPPPSPASGV